MVKVPALLLWLAIANSALAEPPRAPTVLLSGDRVLVALSDAILKVPAVKTRHDSALTTTFIVRARVAGAPTASVARIEIRYDLWDETYRVRRIEAPNRITQSTVA